MVADNDEAISMENGQLIPCGASPSLLHPSRHCIVWAFGSFLFAYNYSEKAWELKRGAFHSGHILSIDYLSECSYWITAGEDKRVVLLSDKSFNVLRIWDLPLKLSSVCFSTSTHFLVADKPGRVFKYSIEGAEEVFTKEEEGEEGGGDKAEEEGGGAFASNVGAAEEDDTLLLQKQETKCVLEDVSCVNMRSRRGDECPDSEKTTKSNFDLVEGQPLMGHLSMITHMSISNDGRWLITGDRNAKIRVSRNPSCYITEMFFLGHTGVITCIINLSGAFGDIVASSATDCTLRFFSLKTRRQMKNMVFFDDPERVPELEKDENCQNSYQIVDSGCSKGEVSVQHKSVPKRIYWDKLNEAILVLLEGVAGYYRVPLEFELTETHTDSSLLSDSEGTEGKLGKSVKIPICERREDIPSSKQTCSTFYEEFKLKKKQKGEDLEEDEEEEAVEAKRKKVQNHEAEKARTQQDAQQHTQQSTHLSTPAPTHHSTTHIPSHEAQLKQLKFLKISNTRCYHAFLPLPTVAEILFHPFTTSKPSDKLIEDLHLYSDFSDTRKSLPAETRSFSVWGYIDCDGRFFMLEDNWEEQSQDEGVKNSGNDRICVLRGGSEEIRWHEEAVGEPIVPLKKKYWDAVRPPIACSYEERLQRRRLANIKHQTCDSLASDEVGEKSSKKHRKNRKNGVYVNRKVEAGDS